MSGTNVKEFFTKEYLSALQRFSIALGGTLKSSGGAGARKSVHKGQSMELSDFREYMPGDNISHIDWNSYSRLDRLVVKLFQEEKQARIGIFIDTSRSMDFGDPNKLLFAKVFAASMAYIALNHMDKITIAASGAQLTVRNFQAKAQFPEILNFLNELSVVNETFLTQNLREFSSSKIAGHKNFLLTDFFSQDGYADGLSAFGENTCALHLISPEEYKPDFTEHIRLIDAETKETKDIIWQVETAAKYEAALRNYSQEIEALCRKRGITYTLVTTDTSLLKLMK